MRRALQSTAEIACRDMGFVGGFLQPVDPSAPVLPPWLSGIRCAGPEANVAACPRSGFGETVTCGPEQRLFWFGVLAPASAVARAASGNH